MFGNWKSLSILKYWKNCLGSICNELLLNNFQCLISIGVS